MESMEIKNHTTKELINLVRAIKNNKICVSSDRCAEDNNKRWLENYLLEITQHPADRIEEADFRLFVESFLYILIGDKYTALKLAFQAGIVGSLYAFFNLIINDRFDLLSSFISNQGTGRNKILLQQFTRAMQSLDQKKINTILKKIMLPVSNSTQPANSVDCGIDLTPLFRGIGFIPTISVDANFNLHLPFPQTLFPDFQNLRIVGYVEGGATFCSIFKSLCKTCRVVFSLPEWVRKKRVTCQNQERKSR